jgi:cytochrome c oxidase assembly factor CtaG
MKAWLKDGLWFGIIASLLFLILSGFGASSEGNIIAALILIPVFPIIILLAPLADLVEGSAGSSFFAAMITSVLVFIGYFIWGMIISKIKSIESTKKKIITIVVIIVAFLILYFVFGFIMVSIISKGIKQGIQPIELFLSMIR